MVNWCGWIDKVSGDKFIAILYDVAAGADVKVNFTLDDVAQKDRKLVEERAFIEWNPFEDKVIFPKVGKWSRNDLNKKSKIVDDFNKWNNNKGE
jgi:hypothetical protein